MEGNELLNLLNDNNKFLSDVLSEICFSNDVEEIIREQIRVNEIEIKSIITN